MLVFICFLAENVIGQQATRKKQQQEVRKKSGPTITIDPNKKAAKTTTEATASASSSKDSKPAIPTLKDETFEIGLDGSIPKKENTVNGNYCPVCPTSSNLLKFAIQKYWENDLLSAFACACQSLLVKPNDDYAKALIYSLRQSKSLFTGLDLTTFPAPENEIKGILKSWEILSPLNVGKLELDGDPTFHSYSSNRNHDHRHQAMSNFDVASYILSMTDNSTTYTDLFTNGKIGWKKLSSKSSGQVSDFLNDRIC